MAGQLDNKYGDRNDLVAEFAKKMNVEPTVLPSGTNPDDIIDNGKYIFENTVLTVVVCGDYVYQIHIIDESVLMYRGYNGSDWSYWFQIANNYDLSFKVDKIPGKGLSTNDYTTAEKTKLNSAVTSSTVAEIVTLTQTAYDALPAKNPAVLYIIAGA